MYGGFLAGNAAAGTLATGVELTTAWNVNAAYEHFWWNPRWRTSLYGGYMKVEYGGTATNLMCTGTTLPPAAAANWLRRQLEHLVGRFAHAVERHQGLLHGSGRAVLQDETATWSWNGHWLRSTVHQNRAQSRRVVVAAFATDQDNWSFRFRVHRDFYP